MQNVLSLRNALAELPRLNAWACNLSATAGLGERDRFRVDLVLCEAVTNIILNAYPEGGTGAISLIAEQAPPSLTIAITDEGQPFNPLAGPEKVLPLRLEDAELGGLGLVLIRGFCDGSQYERTGDQNRLTLVFHTIPAGDGTDAAPQTPMDLTLYQSHRLLMEIPGAALKALVGHCRTVRLEPGEVLLAPGQENQTLYFLLSGMLRANFDSRESGNSIPIGPGEIIGEMSIIEHLPASAWVVADQPSSLLAMPERVFWEEFCPLPHATRTLLQFLIGRVRSTDAALQKEFERKVRYELLQREMEGAGKIQANILPSANPLFSSPRVDAHAVIRPVREVGGDFFDAFDLSDHLLCIAIGDVSGKGMPAALFMVRVITSLRLCLLREPDPARILPELNRQLCEANDEFMFVTLAIVLIDTESGRLTYLNAGHNPPLFSSQGGPFGPWEPPKGVLLGVAPTGAFATKERMLLPGDTIVLYTDGVTEAENGGHELFGLDRAAHALSSADSGGSAAGLVAALEKAVAGFVGEALQSDDITVLVLRYLG